MTADQPIPWWGVVLLSLIVIVALVSYGAIVWVGIKFMLALLRDERR